ncbi:MAG: amidase [Pseudomonadota bacterium]
MTTSIDPASARWHLLSLSAAAAALSDGSCSAEELTSDCLARIRQRNAEINAFVWVDEVGALKAARAADRRRRSGSARSLLDGVPYAVKDNIDVNGMPTSNGICRGGAAVTDAEAVTPWAGAGMVALGKLNMHEAALGTTTENPHFGATRNPLDPAYSAGGSSGGSGASVADFMCPMALGSDTMGSVRLPAASCGVFGWKPTPGVLGLGGMHLLDDELDTAGPLVRTLADMDLLMSHLGHGERDPEPVSFWVLPELHGTPPAAELASLWEMTQSLLAPRALVVGELHPTPLRRAALLSIEARLSREWDADARAHMSTALNAMLEFGDGVSDERWDAAIASRREAGVRIAAALETVDIVITLASPVPPTRLGAEMVPHQADYLLAANLAGAPALTVPAGSTASGLPIGLQLIAAPGRDGRLLDAARTLREHGLWFEHSAG